MACCWHVLHLTIHGMLLACSAANNAWHVLGVFCPKSVSQACPRLLVAYCTYKTITHLLCIRTWIQYNVQLFFVKCYCCMLINQDTAIHCPNVSILTAPLTEASSEVDDMESAPHTESKPLEDSSALWANWFPASSCCLCPLYKPYDMKQRMYNCRWSAFFMV